MWASLLHDIGKLTIASGLLNKPAKPTEEEWAELRRHPLAGAELASPLLDWLGEWGDVIVQHHEMYDGSGYPYGLQGEQISYGARIVSVADAFDVMTAARAYRRPVSRAAARRELVRCSGNQFDPAVVRAMISVSAPRLRRAQGVVAWLSEVPVLATPDRPRRDARAGDRHGCARRRRTRCGTGRPGDRCGRRHDGRAGGRRLLARRSRSRSSEAAARPTSSSAPPRPSRSRSRRARRAAPTSCRSRARRAGTATPVVGDLVDGATGTAPGDVTRRRATGTTTGTVGGAVGGAVGSVGAGTGGLVTGVTGAVGGAVGGPVGSVVDGTGQAVADVVDGVVAPVTGATDEVLDGVTGVVGGLLGGGPTPAPSPSPAPPTGVGGAVGGIIGGLLGR